MAEMRQRRPPTAGGRSNSLSPGKGKAPQQPIHKKEDDGFGEINSDDAGLSDPPVGLFSAPPAFSEVAWSVALAVLSLAALISRVWALHNPGEVVFDEVHFGKFASYYLRNEYYFDVHPPLGKLLLAAVGYLVGYDGHYLFDEIGQDYAENNVPYMAFRLWCALCGAAVVPLAFLTLKEMGVSLAGAVFGAALLVLDNALITQSRLILLDSMLMVFCSFCVYCWVKFRKLRHRAFTFEWWVWLIATGAALAIVTSVKMVGLFTVATIGIATLYDLWDILDINRGLTMRQFVRHFSARALCLIFLPLALYLIPFYIHFAVLYKSGPGDAFMSLKFQEGLVGNAVTSGSVSVIYGSNVTIQHTVTKAYLHSHEHKYPLRYEDGRISSEGQQVNGIMTSDGNSVWEIVAADPAYYPPAGKYVPTAKENERGVRYVCNEDLVRLRHVQTNTYLLTHDVASPLTTTNMETTTTKNNEAVDRYNETLWRVTMSDSEGKEVVKSRKRMIRLINHVHNVALYTDKSVLPVWGFEMHHTNGNKKLVDRGNYWKFDTVVHETIVDGVEKGEAARPGGEGGFSFLQKFAELQGLMFQHNAALTKPHPYSSPPGIWPFVIRGISFWEKKDGLKQIYLLGNPLVWWFVIVGTMFYAALWVIDRMALHRGVDDFGDDLRRWWDRAPGFLLIGWLCHWLPFFLMGRMLFLHHYLPAFIFSVMLVAALTDFIGRAILTPMPDASVSSTTTRSVSSEMRVHKDSQNVPTTTGAGVASTPSSWFETTPSMTHVLCLVFLIGVFTASFVYFAPYSYGTGVDSVEAIRAHKWLSTWDLQYA